MIKKGPIQSMLTAAMADRGWSRARVAKLPAAYVRNQPVSPYFYCSTVLSRAGGYHAIDGALGIIHRAFEERWLAHGDHAGARNYFCMVYHIANVRELHDPSFVEDAHLARDVARFSDAIAKHLDCMPQNHDDLLRCFESNDLNGIPIDRFARYSGREKYDELKEFLLKQASEDLGVEGQERH